MEGQQIRGLAEPIVLRIPVDEEPGRGDLGCAWWDAGVEAWVGDGCTVQSQVPGEARAASGVQSTQAGKAPRGLPDHKSLNAF